jgi:exosortase E/protease (VPEID-CTERM system)
MTEPAMSSEAARRRPFRVARWVGWSALLVTEVSFLSIRFDTVTLTDDHSWWSGLLGHLPLVIRWGLTTVAATTLCRWAWMRGEPDRAATQPRPLRGAWPFLLIHSLAFAGFFCLTSSLFEGGAPPPSAAPIRLVAWLLLGAMTVLSWGAAALPARAWCLLARRTIVPAISGTIIGTAVVGFSPLLQVLWRPLGRSTLWLSSGLLGLISPEVHVSPDGFLVGTPAFVVEIAPACSGYEGIGLNWAFLSVYLWCARRRLEFPQALLLLPLGAAFMWLANGVRIAALVAVGTWLSPAVAAGGFHSQAGWLSFIAISLGLVAVADRIPVLAKAGPPTGRAEGPDATVLFLAPLLIGIAAGMLAQAAAAGFELLYPLRVLAIGGVLWRWRREATGLRLTWSWAAVGIGVAVFACWMALEPAPPRGASSPIGTGLASLPGGLAATWLISRVVGSVIAVPLAEELAFRGYVARRLIAADFRSVPLGRFTWPSYLLSSILFGALHGRWLAGTIAGLLYALAVHRRGELTDAVVAHATTNCLIAAYVLVTGSWSLWD